MSLLFEVSANECRVRKSGNELATRITRSSYFNVSASKRLVTIPSHSGLEPRPELALRRKRYRVLRLHVQQRAGYDTHQEPVLRRVRERAPRRNA